MSFIPVHTPLPAELEALASTVIETWETSLEECPELRLDVSGDDHDTIILDTNNVKLVIINDDDEDEPPCWNDSDHNKLTFKPNDVTDEQWNLLTRAIATHFFLKFPQHWRKSNATMDTD